MAFFLALSSLRSVFSDDAQHSLFSPFVPARLRHGTVPGGWLSSRGLPTGLLAWPAAPCYPQFSFLSHVQGGSLRLRGGVPCLSVSRCFLSGWSGVSLDFLSTYAAFLCRRRTRAHGIPASRRKTGPGVVLYSGATALAAASTAVSSSFTLILWLPTFHHASLPYRRTGRTQALTRREY